MQALAISNFVPRLSNRVGSTRRVAAPCAGEAAPRWNPQNVDNVKVMPSPSLSAVDAVRMQLEACSQNDEPWTNHGIQTMYEFAEDAGGMERSWYFVSFQKDLYHMDHFMGGFSTRLGALIDCQSFKVVEERQDPGTGQTQVDVQVQNSRGEDAGVFTFTLVQRQLGKKKGAWMTKSLCSKALANK